MEQAKVNDAKIDELIETVRQLANGVTTVADLRGIRPEELEALYQFGMGFYQAGNMENAEKVFKLLVLVEHTSAKYNIALAAVRQVNKEYDLAIQGYAAATVLDMTNPKPHYYAAECAFAKGDLETADNCLMSLLELCPAGVGRNDVFREKAQKLRNAVQMALGKKEGAR